MFFLLLLLGFSRIHSKYHHRYPHVYHRKSIPESEPNLFGWLGRTVGKIVGGVGSAIGSVVKGVTHKVSYFISHSSESIYALPCKIVQFDTKTVERDFNTNDITSIARDISNDFNLDFSKVQSFLTKSKFMMTNKQLFNTLKFDKLSDKDHRSAQLASTVIKVTKSGNSYAAKARQIGTTASIEANTLKKSTSTHLFWSSSSYSSSWRALDGNEITNIFNSCQGQIAGKLNDYRNI